MLLKYIDITYVLTNNSNTRRPGVRFLIGTVYLPSFKSFARDSKWGGVPSLNDLAVDGT